MRGSRRMGGIDGNACFGDGEYFFARHARGLGFGDDFKKPPDDTFAAVLTTLGSDVFVDKHAHTAARVQQAHDIEIAVSFCDRIGLIPRRSESSRTEGSLSPGLRRPEAMANCTWFSIWT